MQNEPMPKVNTKGAASKHPEAFDKIEDPRHPEGTSGGSESGSKTQAGDTKRMVPRIAMLVLMAAALAITNRTGCDYLVSSIVIGVLSLIPMIANFECKISTVAEIITLAGISGLVVVSRVAFRMIPFAKPMMGIIMIVGIGLGPEVGFFAGAAGAFLSNYAFRQGAWTPWQMCAYGISGLIMGALAERGIVKAEERAKTGIIGAIVVFFIVGPILNLSSAFTENGTNLLAVMRSGVSVDTIHALSTFVTLVIVSPFLASVFKRFREKHGLFISR